MQQRSILELTECVGSAFALARFEQDGSVLLKLNIGEVSAAYRMPTHWEAKKWAEYYAAIAKHMEERHG